MEGPSKSSNLVDRDVDVVEYISTVREEVHPFPRLVSGIGGPLVEETPKTKREKCRRDEDRRVYEELSRFYALPEKDGVKLMWERPSLPRFSQC